MTLTCEQCNKTIISKKDLFKTIYLGKLVYVCHGCYHQKLKDSTSRIPPLSVVKPGELISTAVALVFGLGLSLIDGLWMLTTCLFGAVALDIYRWVQRFIIVRDQERLKDIYEDNDSYSTKLTQEHISKYDTIYEYYKSFDDVEHLKHLMDAEEFDVNIKGIQKLFLKLGILFSSFFKRFKFLSVSFYAIIFVCIALLLFYTGINVGARMSGFISKLFN